MAKQDLLDEAAELGIVGLDDSFTNTKIQTAINEAKVENAAAATDPGEDEEVVKEAVPVAAPSEPEPLFELAQLRPYAERLFGVGEHVLVGAQSAGKIPQGRVTRAQVRNGIDQYLNMPVEQSKEG